MRTSIAAPGVHRFDFLFRDEGQPEDLLVSHVLIPDNVFRQMEDHFAGIRAAREQARAQPG